MRSGRRSVVYLLATFVAACASSTPGQPPDAEPVIPDAVAIDATPVDAPIDAEPCVPDPDGEHCNGHDDDCDGHTDEGYPGVGEPCDVGEGACNVEGTTICTEDGQDTVCGATAGEPDDELCGTQIDEDCDGETDEGFPDLGQVCSVGAGACLASGIYVCNATGLGTSCNATPGGGTAESCDGVDNDCDSFVDEGFQVNQACDGGADTDLCLEGVWACDGVGGRLCTDQTATTFDVCDGLDNDCDPTSGDGSEDGAVGQDCDGAGPGQDSDLCAEGHTQCLLGALYCNDNTPSTIDLCNGGNDDCDPASADGSEDSAVGVACDGGDTDRCETGTTSCNNAGAVVCSDDAATTPDICDGLDNDCDPSTPDGSGEAGYHASCDGGDSDLCATGVMACNGTALVCSDDAASALDVCDGVDNDCDPTSADGSEEAGFGGSCDGGDSDLCATGAMVCNGTALVCDDDAASALDVCDGVDNDCDPHSADGSEEAGFGASCDGGDSDLCTTGAMVCNGTALVCNDDAASTLDLCGNGDEDCDPASADGSEAAGYGGACDSAIDSDLCQTGAMVCSGTALVCDDDATSLLDVCDGADNDCDPASADGSEQAGFGASCDGGVDTDLCATGSMACNGFALYCTDDDASTVDLCGGGDEDCNPATADGSAQAGYHVACDSAVDTDLCTTGIGVCSGTQIVCTDDDTSTVDLCGGGDEDCDPASGDGSEQPGYNAGCDSAADTDLCATGHMVCSGTVLACDDDSASLTDVCDGVDNDCDPASADGTEQAGYDATCDSAVDTDLCATGRMRCNGAALYCNDDDASTVDLCGGGDEDCDPASGDGSEQAGYNATCDSAVDTDLCTTGRMVCSGTALVCNDDDASTVDMCGGGDEDCDPASADGSEHPGYNATCDSAVDTDLCTTGRMVCSGTVLACNDDDASLLDLCGGGDEDCDPASADGSEQAGYHVACDGGDSDLCSTGRGVCSGTAIVCDDDAASTPDLCGGGDQDCNPATADGSGDPANGAWCDGTGDGDSCLEAQQYCAGGTWVCPDNTGTTVEVCNNADDDCDGVTDDDGGDTNMACSSSTWWNLGSISGDEGGSVSDSWNTEFWDYVLVEETDGSLFSSTAITATISLYSPPGTDYDLYVYCENCGGTLVGASTLGGLTGHTDTVYYKANDDSFHWDDGHIVIEIRHWDSTSCGSWSLTVSGHTSVPVGQICNP